LRCRSGLEIFDSGSVEMSDVIVERKEASQPVDIEFHKKANIIRKEVGMVFQGLNLFPHKTVLENIVLAPIVVKKQSREEAVANAMKLLEKVGLVGLKDRYPDKLSGGQKQRAAIARALAMSPKLMLYDEPTSSLDPEIVSEVLQVMHNLDNEGMTQLVVTHEMRFAKEASDYIIYMEQGEIVEVSGGDRLFNSPMDERTKRFVSHFS